MHLTYCKTFIKKNGTCNMMLRFHCLKITFEFATKTKVADWESN